MSRLRWRLVVQEEAVVRYCQGCGKTTEFRYSGKVRRNANGKQIFQFEIFKCNQDRAWNRPVPVTPLGMERGTDPLENLRPLAPIPHDRWHGGIEIELEHGRGKWRLDKVLAHGLDQAIRTGVAAMIARGTVLLNGSPTEEKKALRTGDVITVLPVSQR